MDLNRVLIGNEKKIITFKNLKIGDGNPIFIAGPCSVESKEQIIETAFNLKKIGVDIIRGGVFKPRTSPYNFQGLGIEGLKYLKEAGNLFELPIVTELISEKYIDILNEYTDIIQIGARNMYNYELLKEVGKLQKPILLKRGLSATIKEWIMAAEYIALQGNTDIIMCERGIRTFNDYTRNTLDLASIPIVKKRNRPSSNS